MPLITCIEDLRRLARRRVSRMFYYYVDSGSWTESTYRANDRDLAAICFRQRGAVSIENRSIRSTTIGEDVAMPRSRSRAQYMSFPIQRPGAG
jgi:L-lactate dehydrogenase (cytochrome)